MADFLQVFSIKNRQKPYGASDRRRHTQPSHFFVRSFVLLSKSETLEAQKPFRVWSESQKALVKKIAVNFLLQKPKDFFELAIASLRGFQRAKDLILSKFRQRVLRAK